MRPVVTSVGPLVAASANNIATSQTLTSPNLTVNLNGSLVANGVATLDSPRHITITSAGNDSGITFTIIGTTFARAYATEVLTGASGAAATSVLDYATITSIVASNSTAGAITVGTSAVAGSSWIRFDDFAPAQTTVQVTVSGTVNYTIQTTLDDPNSATNPVAISSVTWLSSLDSNVVSKAVNASSYFAYTPIFARVILNSGTGSVTATFLQLSNGPI